MIDLSKNEYYKYNYNHTPITAATFLMSEWCNLSCTYCYEKDKHKKRYFNEDLVIKSLTYLFEEAKKHNEQKIYVMIFGGEPTLCPPNVFECLFKTGLEFQSKYNIQFTSNMITNGTYMPDKLFDVFDAYIHQIDNFSIQLSVDGQKEQHNRYRVTKGGHGSFEMIEKNLPKFKRLFLYRPDGLTVHGCLNKETLPYLYENYKFFRDEWNMTRIWFIPVCEEKWDENDVQIYNQEMNKIYNNITTIVKRQNSIKEIENYAPLDRCKDMPGPDSTIKPCGAGTNYITINAIGEFYPCHQIYYMDDNKETIIGNIYQGIDDDKKRLWNEYDGNDLSCPNNCEHKHCYRCPAVNYTLFGTPLTQQQGYYCQLMKTDMFYQKRLHDYIKG